MSSIRYELIKTPSEMKKVTGYLGEFSVYDHEKKVAYAASPANMVCFMNGGLLTGHPFSV